MGINIASVFATSASDRLKSVGTTMEQPENPSLAASVGAVIQIFLSILGIAFMIYMIWAGYNWMTAHGNEEKLNKSKAALRGAIIGMLIVLGAYALTIGVLSRVSQVTITSEVNQ